MDLKTKRAQMQANMLLLETNAPGEYKDLLRYSVAIHELQKDPAIKLYTEKATLERIAMRMRSPALDGEAEKLGKSGRAASMALNITDYAEKDDNPYLRAFYKEKLDAAVKKVMDKAPKKAPALDGAEGLAALFKEAGVTILAGAKTVPVDMALFKSNTRDDVERGEFDFKATVVDLKTYRERFDRELAGKATDRDPKSREMIMPVADSKDKTGRATVTPSKDATASIESHLADALDNYVAAKHVPQAVILNNSRFGEGRNVIVLLVTPNDKDNKSFTVQSAHTLWHRGGDNAIAFRQREKYPPIVIQSKDMETPEGRATLHEGFNNLVLHAGKVYKHLDDRAAKTKLEKPVPEEKKGPEPSAAISKESLGLFTPLTLAQLKAANDPSAGRS